MSTQDDLPGQSVTRSAAMFVTIVLVAALVFIACCGGALIGVIFKAVT